MGRDVRRRLIARAVLSARALTSAPVAPVTARRGNVWWVNLDPTQGAEIKKTRQAVVLSADSLNRVRRTVIAVPLSTGPGSVAVCDQVRAADKARLTRRIGQLTTADLRVIENGVRAALGL